MKGDTSTEGSRRWRCDIVCFVSLGFHIVFSFHSCTAIFLVWQRLMALHWHHSEVWRAVGTYMVRASNSVLLKLSFIVWGFLRKRSVTPYDPIWPFSWNIVISYRPNLIQTVYSIASNSLRFIWRLKINTRNLPHNTVCLVQYLSYFIFNLLTNLLFF
jgi:hypothetical protein